MKKVNKFFPLIVAFCAVVLLSLCFYRDQLDVADYDWFMSYQDDSDLHIRGRIQRTIQTGNPFSDYGFIGQYATFEDGQRFDPYFRQIGIQGLYASLVQKITNSDLDQTVKYTRMLNSLLCAVMCAVFCYWCTKEFGKTIGIMSVIAFAFSPWLTVSARNLYWATWLMFLPAVFMLLLLQYENSHKKYSNILAFLLVFTAVFLKCGAGYEFVSCVLICMELPLIYYAIRNKWTFTKFITRAVVSGVGGVLGFACAVGVNLYQCKLLVGDFNTAVSLMIENISKRTGAFGIEQTNQLIIESLEVSPLKVINTYLFSGQPVLFSYTMAEIIAFFLVMLCVYLATGKGNKASYITAAVSLTGPISWFVLAKGHSYIHCHINYILWSIPAVYLVFLCGADTLCCLVKQGYCNCKTTAQKAVLTASAVIILLYVIACFYFRGNVRGW